MTNLTKILYDYAVDRSAVFICDDPEYQDFCTYAQKREQELRRQLTPAGQSLLDDLLCEQANRHSVELEAVFQAALSLSRELRGIC